MLGFFHRYILPSFLGLALSLSGGPVSAPQELAQDLYAQAMPAVVSIQIYRMQGEQIVERLSHCSGITIDEKGLYLTTWDNLVAARQFDGRLREDTGIFVLRYGEEALRKVGLRAKSQASDLAVLAVDQPLKKEEQRPALSYDPSQELLLGSQLFSVGYPDPDCLEGEIGQGLVTRQEARLENVHGHPKQLFQTNAFISRGSSGAPLFNAKGQWVGMASNSHEHRFADRASYFMPAALIHAQLPRLTEPEEHATLGLGLFFMEAKKALRLQERFQYPPGLVVAQVLENTPAYVANLKAGDIITALDGQALVSREALSERLKEAKVGEALVLTVYQASHDKLLERSVYLGPYTGD